MKVAAKARILVETGVEYGEKYLFLGGDLAEDEIMAVLYGMSAAVSRLDHDYERTYLHNCKRLQFEKNPDDIPDHAIEGMLADASHAGGPDRIAKMLKVFSNLADEKPEWERLTPRLRKILGTDE